MKEVGKTSPSRAAIVIIAILLAVAAAWLTLFRQEAEYVGPNFNDKRAYEYVRRLVAFGPRVQGSAGERDAAEYLRRELTGYGYTVELRPFAIPGDGTGYNVIATRRGEADGLRWLAIGAHYDTVAGTVGANDNASGTAVALELARVFSDVDLPYSLRFVFFSAEEDQNPPREAYSGSAAFVAGLTTAERRACLGYINIDMVGWPGAIYIGNLRPANQELYNLTTEIAKAKQAPEVFSTRLSVDETDHRSFKKADIPTVALGALEYPYRHKPSDNISKISRQRLNVVGRLIASVLQAESKRLGE